MSEREHLEILRFSIGVALLLFGYGYMYKRTRRDRFREDLFTIRDGLFDYMWQNGVSYDLPAYGRLRDTLNGMIRCTDELHLLPLLLCAYLTRDTPPDRLSEAIARIEQQPTRDHFRQVYENIRAQLLRHLFLEGPQWLVFKPLQLLLRRAAKPPRAKPTRLSIEIYKWADDCANEYAVLGKKNSPEARLLRGDRHQPLSLTR